MNSKPVHFLYGIKLVATWMLIPFVVMFIPMLSKEFSFDMSTQEVILGEETYSGYPDEYLSFKTEINGKERVVHAPVTSKEGDTITVVLRNGDYYLTPKDTQTMNSYTTFLGRFLRICNRDLGYHVIGLGTALLLLFLITFKKRKDIRKQYPKLSKITDIGGMIVSAAMSAGFLFAVIDGTLTSLGFAVIGMMAGIAFAAVFLLAWAIECLIMRFAK